MLIASDAEGAVRRRRLIGRLTSSRELALIAAIAAAGCSADSILHIEPTWSQDDVAVLQLLDREGQALESEPWIHSGQQPTRLEVPIGAARLRALVYASPAAGGPDIEARGVSRVIVEGERLPRPKTVWSSDLVTMEPGTHVSLHEVPPPDMVDLGFARAPAGPRDVCEQIESSAIPTLLEHSDLHATVFAGGGVAVAGGTFRSAPPRPLLISIQPSGQVSRIALPDEFGPILALVRGPDGAIHGAAGGGIFRLDTALRVAAAVRLPFRVLPGVTVSSAGTVFAHDATRVFELASGSTVAIERTDFPTNRIALTAVSPDRMVTIADGAVWTFDGRVWVDEYRGPLAHYALDALPPDLLADPERMAVVGAQGVLLRDERTKTWTELHAPFGLLDTRGGAFVGDDLVVIGRTGSAAMWAGSEWCSWQTGVTATLNSIALDFDQRTAVIVTKHGNPETGPLVVRLRFPPR